MARTAPICGHRIVLFDNALTDRQTQAGARIFLCVETFEETENGLSVMCFDADTVILHRKLPIGGMAFRSNEHDWGYLRNAILYRIPALARRFLRCAMVLAGHGWPSMRIARGQH